MKCFELQPTPENILEEFIQDTLGRDVELFRFVELINSLDTHQSIAITENWGAGKTFFVKQIKLILDTFNNNITSISDADRSRVQTTLARLHIQSEVDIQPQVSVYYDAWSNDNDEDPVLSIVYSILQSMSSEYKFQSTRKFLESACAIAEVASGRSFTNLKHALSAENPFEELKKSKNLQTQIDDFLNSLLPERGNRLVIIIDELDRCSPNFAVKLLERVKHYFSNDKITFVFSVNLNELQHTVKNYYGNDFDACRYLDRFFDLSIELPPAKYDRLYQTIGLYDSSNVYNDICKRVAQLNHFSIRETLKFYRMARAAVFIPIYKSKGYGFADEHASLFTYAYFIPIMLGLKMRDRTQYKLFIEGINTAPLIEFFNGNTPGSILMGFLLSHDEQYEDYGNSNGQVLVKRQDKVIQVYNALFNHEYISGNYEVRIGDTTFYAEHKENLLKALSMLSATADFNS